MRVILEHALLPVRPGAEDEFLEAFQHMLKEMKLCRELTIRNAA